MSVDPLPSQMWKEIDVKMRKLSACMASGAMFAGAAAAAPTVDLDFKGTVSGGLMGSVFEYGTSVTDRTSFLNQPVDLQMTIVGQPGDLYVTDFSLTWSNQTYALPFITNWGGVGFPNDPSYTSVVGYQSAVAIGAPGGSIGLSSTAAYYAQYDGGLGLSLYYTLSSPHDLYSSFTDTAVVGGGSIDAGVSDNFDPTIGEFDADSLVNFTFSSVSQIASGVPEPASWTFLIVGFGAAGGALRFRERRPASTRRVPPTIEPGPSKS